MVTEALSISISQVTEIFDFLKVMLLAIYILLIKKAVKRFVYKFYNIPATNQQFILKTFKTESKAYIFNSFTSKLWKE